MQIANDVTEAVRAIPRCANSAVWIAYSGGLDSTVLLHASLTVLSNPHCKAIHVDHGINPKTEEWAEHCQEVCDRWGVSLDIERVRLARGNVELQARIARYQQFERRLQSNDLAVTAHHADDVAESQLWQFLTGRSVVGIASKKVLGKGHVVRPFLHLTKQHLRDYAEKHSLSWIEDPSNADIALDRNWIRHRLLPIIEQRFPDVRTRLSEWSPSRLPEVQKGPLELANTPIDAGHVRAWLLAHGSNPPNTAIDEIIRQSQARPDSSPIVQISDQRQVRRYRGRLYLVTFFPPFDPREAATGVDMELSNGSLTWTESSRGLSPNQTFELRNRSHFASTKLTMRINAMSKSISSLFQEKGIAPWLRDGWPILMKSERVVCVPGIALADETRDSSNKGQACIPIWNPKTD